MRRSRPHELNLSTGDAIHELEIALSSARIWGVDAVRREPGASRILLADEHALAAFPAAIAPEEQRTTTGPYTVRVPDEELPDVIQALRKRTAS
jgi:hypothetical protein